MRNKFYLYDQFLLVTLYYYNSERTDIVVPKGKLQESRIRKLGVEDLQNPEKRSPANIDYPVRYEGLFHSPIRRKCAKDIQTRRFPVLAVRRDIIVLPYKELSRLHDYRTKRLPIDASYFPYAYQLEKPYIVPLLVGSKKAIESLETGHPLKDLLPSIEHAMNKLNR